MKKNNTIRRIFAVMGMSLLLSGSSFAAYADDTPPPSITPSDILPYLEKVIAWHKSINSSDITPDNAREAVIRDKLKQNSKQALDKSFDFARAQTVIFRATGASHDAAPADDNTRRGKMLKSSAEINARISDIDSKLKAGGLSAGARENLNGQMRLAKAQQDLLQTMMRIFITQGEQSGSLIDQINALSHSASDDLPEQATTAKPSAAAADADAQKENTAEPGHDAGIFNLCSTLFSYSHKKGGIDDIDKQTKSLINKNHVMIGSIRTMLKDALAEGNALSTNNANDAKSLATYHQKLDALLDRYKQLSGTVIPLGEMVALLESDDRHLSEWSELVNEDWKHVFHQLLLRLLVLSVGIAIPLVCAELAFRAINRYIQDPKRKHQLKIVTRVLLYIALAFVILANFITEFGSLATFAGFITAGLAVALQTVLVSLVAHFFFYGRYGVRVGDRVTIGDVTGDIVQIGMLRIYLRQYTETDKGLQPSGKLVAFPNSILFQPAAFYKHLDEQELKNSFFQR